MLFFAWALLLVLAGHLDLLLELALIVFKGFMHSFDDHLRHIMAQSPVTVCNDDQPFVCFISFRLCDELHVDIRTGSVCPDLVDQEGILVGLGLASAADVACLSKKTHLAYRKMTCRTNQELLYGQSTR